MYISGWTSPLPNFVRSLREWLDRVRGGEEGIVTERGVPVARMLGISASTTLQRLAADEIIGRDVSARRPTAIGRERRKPRRPISDAISEQRG